MNIESLNSLLRQSGIALNQKALEQLWAYHNLLREANSELNLTRIFNFESMVRKHYVDSLIVPVELKKAGLELSGSVMDLGSGPGLPGIPLAILLPQSHFILAEGRSGRVDFLNQTIHRLGLENTEVYGHNVGKKTEIRVDIIITRAVETMLSTMDHSAHCLRPGGRFVFMKGPNCDTEIKEVEEKYGSPPICDLAYDLPHSKDHRRLIVWKAPALKERAHIVSRENERFKLLSSLSSSRGIKKNGRALFGGKKIIEEALKNPRVHPEAFIASGSVPVETLSTIPLWRFSGELFQELDVSGTGSPLLLVRTPEIPLWIEKIGSCLFLPLSNPENLGSAIRSASAFGFQKIVLLKEAAHPFLPATIRASAGEIFRVELFTGPSVTELKAPNLVILDGNGMDIRKAAFPADVSLLIGMEGTGVPPNLKAQRIALPMEKGINSLNASAAASIAMFYLRYCGPTD